MRVLIVAATEIEIEPLKAAPSATHHQLDMLVTGVGMVATAANCSETLTRTRYDLALNFGVCGSFDPAFPPPAVVHVVSYCLAEMGAEDDDRFLTVQELELLGNNEFPFTNGRLVNPSPPPSASLKALPQVKGITVNTVHGNKRSIDAVAKRFSPQVESMEGAAFMYACLVNQVPFAQVRAVSNVVETRNRASWKLADAVSHLNRTALAVLDELVQA